MACLAYMVADTLRFNIIDKDNNSDLFFSDNPVYSIQDVKLLTKNSVNQFDTLALQVRPAALNTSLPIYQHLYLKVKHYI